MRTIVISLARSSADLGPCARRRRGIGILALWRRLDRPPSIGPSRRLRRAVSLAIFVALLAHGALAAGPKSAQIVARIGPWPVVSNLIAFRGRIWFVNSVTGRNHNSADIYSYAPSNGALRYERHLFSQDAGRPTAGDGWLYWPFEDDRFSLG